MKDVEPAVAAALDRLAPPAEAAVDWDDVLARSCEVGGDDGWSPRSRVGRRPRRRRRLVVLALLLVAAAVLLATPAFGLRARLFSLFDDAEPAPTPIVKDFQSLEFAAIAGMVGADVIPGQARKVLEMPMPDGRLLVVYAAPTRSGGFCTAVAVQRPGGAVPGGVGAGCVGERDRRVGVGVSMGAVAGDGTVIGGPVIVSGHVEIAGAASVELAFEDGTETAVPFVLVSEPIGVGLFAYAVPRDHWRPGALPTALIVRDGAGGELARDLSVRGALDPQANRNCPLPCEAILTEKRTLIEVTTERGIPVTQWVAPSATGGQCAWVTYNQPDNAISSGCPASGPTEPIEVGLHGGKEVLVEGRVRADVATLDLVFEDGDLIVLRPVEGYVLAEVPSRHYTVGKRLERMVARDDSGRVVSSRSWRTDVRGLYPCDHPEQAGTYIDGEPFLICP